jgi:RNA polymerase sigma-70 factor (ECF subfamily)
MKVPVSADGPLDRDAMLRQLVALHFDFVWRLLRRLGVEAADVDDAAQQVFIVVAGRLHGLDLDRAREFLFGVALRVAANARRSKQRRREIGDESLSAVEHPSLDPEAALDRRKGIEVLDAILQSMPEELSLILILTEIEGMSKSEAAVFLAIPEGTVASRLKRARERFRSLLQRSLFIQSTKAGQR